MERVDHIDVVQVGGGGLVGKVYGVFQRQVPDGEGFKLGVARLDAALVLVVQLGQADCHLAAAGAGRGDDHQRAFGLDVFVFAVAVVAYDTGNIVGVAGNFIVAEAADAHAVQLVLKLFDFGVGGVHRDADAANKQPHTLECVDQAQHVHVVGDAVVAAHLVVDDVLGADDHHDLGLAFQLQQHLQLGIGLKARQHAGGVVVVKQLAAKFQIQLVVKLRNAFTDARRLCF